MTTKVKELPFQIVAYESADLRRVLWNQTYLEAKQREYRLKPGKALLIVNGEGTKYRLVINFFGIPCLMLPPVDADNRLSLALKVSQFLRRFCKAYREAVYLMDQLDAEVAERIQKRKEAAKKHEQIKEGVANA